MKLQKIGFLLKIFFFLNQISIYLCLGSSRFDSGCNNYYQNAVNNRQILTVDYSSFQQLCRKKSLDSSMQESQSLQERREAPSHTSAPSSSLEAGRSSVGKNVEKKTFLFKQLATELREADMALDTKEKCMNHLHFCM